MTDRRMEVGACGVYCAGCLDYRALVENDRDIRRQAASAIKNETGIDVPLDQIGCEGCWGGIHTAWAASLECRIRQCVDARRFATCAECTEFPCEVYLNQFADNSDHANNIRAIRSEGLNNFLEGKQRS